MDWIIPKSTIQVHLKHKQGIFTVIKYNCNNIIYTCKKWNGREEITDKANFKCFYKGVHSKKYAYVLSHEQVFFQTVMLKWKYSSEYYRMKKQAEHYGLIKVQ